MSAHLEEPEKVLPRENAENARPAEPSTMVQTSGLEPSRIAKAFELIKDDPTKRAAAFAWLAGYFETLERRGHLGGEGIHGFECAIVYVTATGRGS